MNHVIGKVRCPQAHRSNAVCAPMARRATDLVRHVLRGPSLRAKLTVGPANDRYEQEADRVAEQVMSMPAGHEGMRTAPSNDTPGIQRMCAGCEEEVRRQPVAEEEEELRTKRGQRSAPAMGANFQARIGALRGQGQPLPASTRAFFEPRFGYRFDQVRVHKDGTAAALAESLQARAFTFGADIAFASNAYQPDTGQGRKLLAHELTHVVQQSGGRQAVIQRAVPEEPEASEEGFRRAPPRVPLSHGLPQPDCGVSVKDVFWLGPINYVGIRPECRTALFYRLPDLSSHDHYRADHSLAGKPKCEAHVEGKSFWLHAPPNEWRIVEITESSATVMNLCGEEEVLYASGSEKPPQAGEGAAAADPLPKNLVENPRGAKGTVCALRYDDNCDNVWFVPKGSAPADSTFCDPPEKWQWDAEKAAFVAEIIGAGGETEIGTKHPDMLQRFAGIVLKTQLETGEWVGTNCGTVPREFQRPGD